MQQHERLFRNSGMENRLSDEKDLCVMAPPVERDRLTRLLEGPFSLFFPGQERGWERGVCFSSEDQNDSFLDQHANCTSVYSWNFVGSVCCCRCCCADDHAWCFHNIVWVCSWPSHQCPASRCVCRYCRVSLRRPRGNLV